METIKFNELSISQELKKAIEDMGFENATPVQSQSIIPIMEGKDLVAQAPTGTGKTCAFGIPLIESVDPESKTVDALILCPTRELVIQTAAELLKLCKYKESIRMCAVYGGQSIDRQMMTLRRKPQIVVATPGRLMDHMRRHTIKLDNLKYMVMDEADEMLNMGFREDIDEILKTVPEERQTVLFSATMSEEIQDISNRYLHEPARVQITKSELTVPNIAQYYLEVARSSKTDVLARLIDINDFKLSMIFCNTKRMVDDLAHDLTARGYSAEGLHGDMKQAQRDRVMRSFKSGQVEILIATDVAARGIDVDDVEAVFNYDLPVDLEYYVHRIGRTGRANRKGVSYSFVYRREMNHLREIMDYTKAKIQLMRIPDVSEITEIRTARALKEIEEILEKGNMEIYERAIEKWLEDSDKDYTTMDIAAAFMSREVRAEEFKELPPIESDRRRDRDGRGDRGDRGNRGERRDRGDRRDRGERGDRRDRGDRKDRGDHKDRGDREAYGERRERHFDKKDKKSFKERSENYDHDDFVVDDARVSRESKYDKERNAEKRSRTFGGPEATDWNGGYETRYARKKRYADKRVSTEDREFDRIQKTSERREKNDRKFRDKKEKTRDHVRLFMNLGKGDNLKKKQIMAMISDKTSVNEKNISKLDVLDKYTFMDTTMDSARALMDNLNGKRVNGRKVSIEFANKKR